jgi:hypothetical protein
MIRRLYAHNFKSLTDFELRPGPMTLLAGETGSGKTNVLDAFKLLRRFVFRGRDVAGMLPRQTLTRWSKDSDQVFELSVDGEEGLFELAVVVEHPTGSSTCLVALERLLLDGRVLLEASRGDARAHRGTDGVTTLSVNPTRSALEYVASREGGPIAWFHQRMTRLFVLQLQPQVMQEVAIAENRHPSATMFNFAMWWRHLAQEDPDHTQQVIESLRGAIDHFDMLRLIRQEGRDRHLMACFKDVSGVAPTAIDYGLSELSDGQRSLIALYTLLHVNGKGGVTMCVDSPDKVLTANEVERWATALVQRTRSDPVQGIITSSRVESLGGVDPSSIMWLERGPAGRTSIRPAK